MGHSKAEINVTNIFLALDNPRHQEVQTERDAMQRLLDNEQVREIARDIAERGSISPLESIAVVANEKSKGSFIALEGNRRVCALKLLLDPEQAPAEASRRYFRSLAEKASINPVIEVVQFDSREEAVDWISLRHEGQQGGRGVRTWGANEKARFNERFKRAPANPNVLSNRVLDYAVAEKLISKEDAENFPLTTLTRYLGGPVVRNYLGIVSRDELKIDVPEDEFKVAISRLLTDAISVNSKVTSRQNKEEREAYMKGLADEGVLPRSRTSEPIEIGAERKKQPRGKAESRNNPNPKTRKRIVPSAFAIRIDNAILKRVFDELRSIEPERFPFASVGLFRTLLDKASSEYLKSCGRTPKTKLHERFSQLAEQLESSGKTDREVKILRILSSRKDDWSSPDSLGHFVHAGSIPTKSMLIDAWDSLEHIFQEILS